MKRIILAAILVTLPALAQTPPDAKIDQVASDLRALSRIAALATDLGDVRQVMLAAANAYRVEVSAPTKRNLVSANNRVYVRSVIVDSTGFDGKTVHHEI